MSKHKIHLFFHCVKGAFVHNDNAGCCALAQQPAYLYSADLDEVLGRLCEVHNAILGYRDHILYAAAVLSGKVNARLKRDDLSGGQQLIRRHAGGKARLLMNVHSHAVTEGMSEGTDISRTVDYIACDLIHACAALAGAGGGKRGGLCLKHGVVEAADVVVGFADDDGTSHIGAIAVIARAEIHCKEAFFELNVARHAVRHG